MRRLRHPQKRDEQFLASDTPEQVRMHQDGGYEADITPKQAGKINEIALDRRRIPVIERPLRSCPSRRQPFDVNRMGANSRSIRYKKKMLRRVVCWCTHTQRKTVMDKGFNVFLLLLQGVGELNVTSSMEWKER